MNNFIQKTVIILCRDINSRGSGFIVDSNGLVATNHHVISDYNGNQSKNIEVIFDNDTKIEANIISANKYQDFAILKINQQHLQCFEIGSFKDVKEFSEIFFLGQGLDVPKISLHKGWISRKVKIKDSNALQIDGPINQGNSGGPVVNSDGKVVAIITRTEAKFDSDLINLLKILPNIQGDIKMFGIRLPETLRRIIYFLNRNRFVGIGYAISIEYLQQSLKKVGKLIEK